MRTRRHSGLAILLSVYILLHNLPASISSLQTNCKSIDAAFSLNSGGGTYFLSGSEYIEYNFRLESEGKFGRIRELGLDPVLRNVDAAYTDNNGTVVFLKDCQFYRFVGWSVDGMVVYTTSFVRLQHRMPLSVCLSGYTFCLYAYLSVLLFVRLLRYILGLSAVCLPVCWPHTCCLLHFVTNNHTLTTKEYSKKEH